MSDIHMITDKRGTKRWYNDEGQLHRTDGPAKEYASGAKVWYLNGKLHRLDGPAIKLANGSEEWYKNDSLHREIEDGPAVTTEAGGAQWWVDGELICRSREYIGAVKPSVKIKSSRRRRTTSLRWNFLESVR